MRRPRGLRPAAAGLLACAVLVALLAVGSLVLAQHGSGGGSPPASLQPSATATLSSRTVLFGDTVEARLDLVLPRSAAPSAFRGAPNFTPFRIVSSQVERTNLGGGLERISLRYGLSCLSPHCLGAGPSTTVQFAPPTVSIPGGSLRAVWPSLVEVSRAEGVARPVADGLDSGPVVPPGLQPRLNAYEALGAAGGSLVLLLAAWLLVRLRVRRRRAALAARGSVLQALLTRVEAALPEDVVYRQRHALDALAVELRHRHADGALFDQAERLAWSPEQPDPIEIRSLVAEVRRLVET